MQSLRYLVSSAKVAAQFPFFATDGRYILGWHDQDLEYSFEFTSTLPNGFRRLPISLVRDDSLECEDDQDPADQAWLPLGFDPYLSFIGLTVMALTILTKPIVYACLLAAVLGSMNQAVRADEDDETTIEFHGPVVRPGYPNPFSIGYILRQNTLSPDRRYGVIFPRLLLALEKPEKPDFVVDRQNSAILGAVEVNESTTPYYEHQNYGGLSVWWSPDSAAALIGIEAKWMPGALVVIEIKDGTLSRQTDLSGQVERLFSPARAKHTRSHETEVSEYSVSAVKWKLTEKSRQLELNCKGQTNSRRVDQDTWKGTFDAVWDLEQQRFLEPEVIQTGFTRAGKEDQ